MWNKQIILILCMLWIGGSAAKSFRHTSFDYDYREESRKSSNNYRGKSGTTTSRPSFQTYWKSFLRHIPTLPPFRWNMTNSFSNLFNNGDQQIMETPVAMEEEPNRRWKNSKRKLSTKKNKNHRAQSRVQSSYYNYHTPTYYQDDRYQQIQLQPIGLDEKNIMHFYEHKTGNYYAMQMVSAPSNLYNNYYNNHEDYTHNSEDSEKDDGYHNEGYGEKEHNDDDDYDTENIAYDNEYNNDAEHESEHDNKVDEDYADDVELADNWGYTDDEIFADRKLKGSLNVMKPLLGEMELPEHDIASSIVKIQKHLLKPESEDDVMVLLSKNYQKTNANRLKPTAIRETSKEKDAALVRNILGSFMKDDLINRKRQSANTKQSSRLVEKPRQKGRYYIFPTNFWLK